MNLEALISKYLDGEMNEQEDEILRNSLSADFTARLKFDSAVNLHLAMKEDAESIFPSDDLVAQTEDLILMKIFANAPDARKRRSAVWSYVPMLAATIAFFMFAFVFEISDVNQLIINNDQFNQLTINNNQLSIGRSSDQVQQKSEDRSQKIEGSELTIDNSHNNSQLAIMEKGKGRRQKGSSGVVVFSGGNLSGGSLSSKDVLAVNAPVNPVALSQPDDFEQIFEIEINSEIKSIPDNNFLSLTSYDNINTEVHLYSNNNIIPNTIDLTPIVLRMEIPVLSDLAANSEVQVASFFGTDIARGGIDVNEAVISHFSQSVAYAVNENERYGVEIGYTQYSYSDKGTVNVQHKIGSVSGVEAFEGGYGFTVSYPQVITLQSDKQIIWASAFYENTIFKSNGLALTGRLGVGGTSDGPLGYGRIFAQYTLFNGIALTFGTEGRMFSAEFSKFSEEEDKFKTTASLIYGIQFRF